ncbi:wax ester/triacylglycerol synthase domain-containing protein [Nocardia brasiliensis]|uniref:wax ester/triacylglycerol synthase domain-containing protein n=1 Tax=Nocardia brasiliensis TaxID=37326 RepID=UPI003671AA3E
MAAQDATMYWLSARTRNDLFLLYCFADTGRPSAELRAIVAERSARIPDLRVRVRSVPGDLDYPSWVPCEFTAEQFVEHLLPEPDWAHLEAAVGEVVGTGVDAAVRPWRVHVFRSIVGAPGLNDQGPALVVVLQMSHALADGRRAAEIARALFSADVQKGEPSNGAVVRVPAAREATAAALASSLVTTARSVAAAVVRRPTAALADSVGRVLRVPVGLVKTAPIGTALADSVSRVRRVPVGLEKAAPVAAALADSVSRVRCVPVGLEEVAPVGAALADSVSRVRCVPVGLEEVAPVGAALADSVSRVRRVPVGLEKAAPVAAALMDSVDRVRRIPVGLVTAAPVAAALSVPRMPIQLARTAVRGYHAFRAQQRLAELTATGQLPPPGPDFPPSLINHVREENTSVPQEHAGATAPRPLPDLPCGVGDPVAVEDASAQHGRGRDPVVVADSSAHQEPAQFAPPGHQRPPAADLPSGQVARAATEAVAAHKVRMIVRDAAALRVPGCTVTVVVLTAVSVALARYLESRGDPVERLGAQVPMALSGTAMADARNNYRSLSVDLFIDEPDLRRRADKITAALADRRLRAQHPLLAAQDRVTAVVPAPLLRRDIARYPLDIVPDAIAGHTVVSSVHRGPADLTFGGGQVHFTGGFPAIGSVMQLTHGVHGLGATVTISLHADSATVPDIDVYADLLRTALDEAVRSWK